MSATDKFKTSIELLPQNPKDINILFSISYAEYQAEVSILSALGIGSSILQNGITTAIGLLNDEVYGTIAAGLGALNSVKSLIPNPVVGKMDVSVGAAGELLALACTDYMGSLPEDLFNIIQDLQNDVNSILSMDFSIDLGGLVTGMVRSILALKDAALAEILGSSIFATIIAPLIAYNEFLVENGILDIINRLERLERCMTKPGVGNMPKSYFIEPTSKKLYSTYFRNLFMMNYAGGIDITNLGSNSKSKSHLNNVMSSLNSFRLTIY